MRVSILMTILIVLGLFVQVPEAKSSNYIQMIPEEAIRLRILAHSNSEVEQQLKLNVRDKVNNYISQKVYEAQHIEEARHIVRENIFELEQLLMDVIPHDFSVEYNTQVDFPEKVYGDYVYPADTYEAVLITIGDGAGDNWWCVLFPPLCFVDVSTDNPIEDIQEDGPGESNLELIEFEEENSNSHSSNSESGEQGKTEYRSFLLDWLGWS